MRHVQYLKILMLITLLAFMVSSVVHAKVVSGILTETAYATETTAYTRSGPQFLDRWLRSYFPLSSSRPRQSDGFIVDLIGRCLQGLMFPILVVKPEVFFQRLPGLG